MGRVLIVEDETVLRSSLARGLGRVNDVEVFDAASVNQALALIDERPPDLIISDIDMPERTGIELLGEIGRRGMRIPIIFVSAYLKAYGPLIPRHADIEVLEKPVGLDEMRRLVQAKLGGEPETGASGPFSTIDFLQLAGMGRRSVVIEVRSPDGETGSITVCDGRVRDARCGELTGLEAFARMAWTEGAQVKCRTLEADPSEATLDDTVESLLMLSATALDEAARDGRVSEVAAAHARTITRAPPAIRQTGEDLLDLLIADGSGEASADDAAAVGRARDFRTRFEEGVAAMLDRDFDRALTAFLYAEAALPGDKAVLANIARLQEMGFGEDGEEE